jgi:hypothetical protein
LDTSQAQSVRSEAKQGFPFEASLRFDPARSVLVNIPEGREAQVNGRTLKGPGTIIKNALVLEGSVTVFGSLANTSSKIFHQERQSRSAGTTDPEAAFRAEWESKPELRAEFGDDEQGLKRFLAYSKAKSKGMIHEIKPRAVRV